MVDMLNYLGHYCSRSPCVDSPAHHMMSAMDMNHVFDSQLPHGMYSASAMAFLQQQHQEAELFSTTGQSQQHYRMVGSRADDSSVFPDPNFLSTSLSAPHTFNSTQSSSFSSAPALFPNSITSMPSLQCALPLYAEHGMPYSMSCPPSSLAQALANLSRGASPTFDAPTPHVNMLGSSPPLAPSHVTPISSHPSLLSPSVLHNYNLSSHSQDFQENAYNPPSRSQLQPSHDNTPHSMAECILISQNISIPQAAGLLLSMLRQPACRSCHLIPDSTTPSNNVLTLTLNTVTLARRANTLDKISPSMSIAVVPVLENGSMDALSLVSYKVSSVLEPSQAGLMGFGVSPDAMRLEPFTGPAYQMQAASLLTQRLLNAHAHSPTHAEVLFSPCTVKIALQILIKVRAQVLASNIDVMLFIDLLSTEDLNANLPGLPAKSQPQQQLQHTFHCKIVPTTLPVIPPMHAGPLSFQGKAQRADHALITPENNPDAVALVQLLGSCPPASFHDGTSNNEGMYQGRPLMSRSGPRAPNSSARASKHGAMLSSYQSRPIPDPLAPLTPSPQSSMYDMSSLSPNGTSPIPSSASSNGRSPIQGSSPTGRSPVKGSSPFGRSPVQGSSPTGRSPVRGSSPTGRSPVRGSSPTLGRQDSDIKADYVVVTEETAVKNAAGAITKVLGRVGNDGTPCPVYTGKKSDSCVGAVSAAVKAIAVARGYVTNEGTGHDVGFRPYIRDPNTKPEAKPDVNLSVNSGVNSGVNHAVGLGSRDSDSGISSDESSDKSSGTIDNDCRQRVSDAASAAAALAFLGITTPLSTPSMLLPPNPTLCSKTNNSNLSSKTNNSGRYASDNLELDFAFDVLKLSASPELAAAHMVLEHGPSNGSGPLLPVKVTANSRPTAVAKVLAKVVHEKGAAVLVTAGGQAMQVAMAAVITTRERLRSKGVDILLFPNFVTVDTSSSIGWESVFIRFVIVKWDK